MRIQKRPVLGLFVVKDFPGRFFLKFQPPKLFVASDNPEFLGGRYIWVKIQARGDTAVIQHILDSPACLILADNT